MTDVARKEAPIWKLFKDRRANPDDILRAARIIAPPVPVREIVRMLDVTLTGVPRPGWSGAVRSDEANAQIWYASDEGYARQRFTVAHELGHLMLHDLGQQFRDVTFTGTREESEANAFAADLLMPVWMLDPAAMSLGADIEKLAKMFWVSPAAMSVRLGRLGR